MPRYKVTVTAELASPVGLDAMRLRSLTGGKAQVIAPDVARIVVVTDGTSLRCAGERAVDHVTAAVTPLMQLKRPAVWAARPTGVRRLTFRGASGGFSTGLGGDDDGLGGVREPRRPLPGGGSAAIALDPPVE